MKKKNKKCFRNKWMKIRIPIVSGDPSTSLEIEYNIEYNDDEIAGPWSTDSRHLLPNTKLNSLIANRLKTSTSKQKNDYSFKRPSRW